MRKLKSIGALAVSSVMLAGCVVTGPGPGPSRPSGPVFAEGNWQQEDIASYTFGNGSFVGTATDTGNRLSDGTYRYTGAQQVNITGVSALRGTSFSANCLLVNAVTMNCTSSSGAQFSLIKRTGFS